jgi:hypothetical protein
LPFALTVCGVWAPAASAQDQAAAGQASAPSTDEPTPPDNGKKKVELIYAPVPFASPTSGFGIAGGVVALYNPNNSPNQWVTGGGVAWTTRGTKALAVFHRMSSSTDGFRLDATASWSNQDIKFYGIGEDDGDRNDPLPLDNKTLGARANLTWRVAPRFYAGFRYRLTTNDAAPGKQDENKPPSATPPPPADQLRSTLSMIGPSVEFDTRDNHDQPRAGVDLTAVWLIGFKGLGDSYEHNKLVTEAHGYFSLSQRTVVAASRGVL